MHDEAPGYARPVQSGDLSVEAERQISAACPGAVVAEWPAGKSVHPIWGPCEQVLTGAASDPETRFEGSSGGALSALLVHALERGDVDRVLHTGADPERPSRNLVFISRTSAEIVARAGSRYTASSPMAAIREALDEGGRFAFVGKPCDVSALRRLARTDPRIGQCVPLALSFFCGGIPSHAGVDRILEAFGVKANDLVQFRYRGRGWPGMCEARTPSGAAQMTYADSWGRFLSKEVQFRCKICPDAVGGVADIACADAWYGDEAGYPSFDEQEGRSLIISRSAVGRKLVESAVAAGQIEVSPLDIGEIDKMQPSQAKRKRLVLARTTALALLGQPSPRFAGLKVLKAASRAAPAEAVRNLLGTIRRTLKGTRSRL
ncbi:Coenzyme F420 hydrogenase/dehydrogenase, beta subunit C-terminal domain [Phenylobacterium sp.]|uniref:Coenzyme F420 hydrogenase/dehydrogenase, beta subunit C-terminal domain n=1 Tax=Phenylobacterium sp. TaxID=1871053 RepID=UPI00301C72F2